MLFLHRESLQGEARSKRERDSDSNIPMVLVSSNENKNKSKDQEPKDKKDEKQNTKVDETIGVAATLKSKLHLYVNLMDKIFKNLQPKMLLTPPSGFDVSPFLKVFENSIDICNGFNTLQTVDLPPPHLILSKEASITTTPSTTAALAITTLVVPATLPKDQLCDENSIPG